MQSFLQSGAWQQFSKTMGLSTLRQSGVTFTERTVPGGNYWLASRCVIKEKIDLTAFSNAIFVRFEPLDSASLIFLQQESAVLKKTLRSTVAIQPRQTVIVPIAKTESEILQNMKPKHRYNIRLAQKHGVQVEIINNYDPAAFERFWQLLSITATRQHFRTHTKSYYEKLLSNLVPEKMAHLLMAHKDGTDLAGMILMTYQETATYLHGGSSEELKNLMAPFALHWEAIKFSKELGCTEYDLWGSDLKKNEATGEWEPLDGHASAGTSRFKAGFGGTVVEYPGTFDLVLNPTRYALYTVGRKLATKPRAFS